MPLLRVRPVLQWGLLAACALPVAAACRRSNTETPAPASSTSAPLAASPTTIAADTVRGIVQRVGSDPTSVLVLSAARDQTVFALRGSMLDQLGRAVGLEVMISGARSTAKDYSASPRGATIFEVEQFFVRGADGQVALDGILSQRNGVFVLAVTGGSEKSVPFLPAALRGHIGSRVFLVGGLEQAPAGYGILSERK